MTFLSRGFKNLQWYGMTNSIENFGFRCFFVVKTLKEVWVKMWFNRLTHTVTHTRKYAEIRGKSERAPERNFGFLSGVFIIFGVYITCAMKLPMVCAASSCFWRVAWV